LSSLRLADLRPSAIRSVMERRLNMASTPIIRYYDHLRFVYEVESRMRELRRTTQTEGQGTGTSSEKQQKDKDSQSSAPSDPKKVPGVKDGGSRMDLPQQSVNPANNPAATDSTEILESILTFQERPAQSGGSAQALRERSTVWTA